MAVISTYINDNTGVLFTASFDCIIGIDVKTANSPGGYLQKRYSGTSEGQSLGNTSTGSKIANIILKAGDQILVSDNVRYSVYITGVSV